jgi:predicted nucleotidyltransferase
MKQIMLTGQKIAPVSNYNRERKILALKIAQSCADLLITEFKAEKVILFGSLAGQTPWHDFSDIDLAVEGLPEGSFFRAYSLCRDLLPEGIDLDLVPLETAYPEIKTRILQGKIMNTNSLEALKSLIDNELLSLQRLVEETQKDLSSLKEPPTQLEMNGLASYLHQYYTAIEGIFRRIAINIDNSLPTGEKSHLDLLTQMSSDISNVRKAVINPQQYQILKEYLGFRHFFRHAYGYQLRWAEIRLKLMIMPENFAELKINIEELLTSLIKSQKQNGSNEI